VITWDEPKRLSNIAAHGVDFAACASIFDYPMFTVEDDRGAYGGKREIKKYFKETGVGSTGIGTKGGASRS
jgi:uncharacterized DUF497 family protein